MTNYSGVPRPFGITDARRRQEEDARRMEQAVSARNTASTTIGAGGRLDLDGGDLDIFNGGNTRVRDGGRFLVEGGGSMDITDDGQINVTGAGRDWLTKEPITVSCSLANRSAHNSWIGYDYLQPGLYFSTGASRGAVDPRVTSEDGVSVRLFSAVELLRSGPHVGPDIVARGDSTLAPDRVSIGIGSWDDAVNPGGGDGLNGLKGSAFFTATPSDILLGITNYDYQTAPSIPQGDAVSISGTLEEGVLRLYGRAGVDISGPLTVDGAPISTTTLWGTIPDKPSTFPPSAHTHTIANVTGLQAALDGKSSTGHTHAAATTGAAGFMSTADKAKLDGIPAGGGSGAVTSVAGKTGDVTLVKADAGLGNVDNTSDAAKPVSTATQTALNGKANTSHTHTTAQITGLDTALAGKASTAVVTSTTAGLMSSTDKAKLDGATPSATANRLVYRDTSGRAKVTDPAAADDIATKGYVDTAVAAVPRMVTGTKAIGVVGAGTGRTEAITFTGFSAPPKVFVSTNSTRLSVGYSLTTSTTAAELRVDNFTTGNSGVNSELTWVAIGF